MAVFLSDGIVRTVRGCKPKPALVGLTVCLPEFLGFGVSLVGHERASLGIISLLHIDATIDITPAPMNSDNILVTDRDMTDILNNVALVHVGDR
jgi:hypothetical protein